MVNLHQTHPVNRIAEKLTLELDCEKINLTAKLAGEAEPIRISAAYEIKDSKLCISEVKSEDKQWVNGVWEMILKDDYSEIPLNELTVKIFKHLV
ncbi:MAG: hypothetical protein FWC26_09235 [Fibromonadales bacterium]|nr:hypothetical protein [Fibromonadales bacterium]